MSNQIVMVDITAYDKVAGQPVALRFCDGLAYRLRPTETPANALYRPFLTDPGWCRVDVFTAPGQYGHITPGEVVVNDATGTLGKALINYAFDGRSIVIRIGARGAAYPDGLVTVISGTMDGQPSFDWDRITFRPADLAAGLQKALPVPRYAGNNALPAGLEGVDDIKGNVKPLVLALASNMTPILVNSTKLIYQVSAPAGSQAVSASAARDKGVPLTAGSGYATVADLLDDSKAPAAGTYKALSTTADGCFVRVGSKPVGALTVDAAYGSASDRTHAQVWKRILAYGGVAAASVSASDVAALDAALAAEIEYAIFSETTISSAATEVATSAGAAWYGDAVGIYRLTQWAAPSGTPVATLTNLRTASMDIGDPVGNGDVAPAYRVTMEYGRNWTTQADANLGGDKTSASDTVRAPGGRAGLVARAWLAVGSRTVYAEDQGVKVAHPRAIELKLTSFIADQAAAQTYCNAQLAMYSVARHMTPLTQFLSPEQIAVCRPGAVVLVKQPRWNYDAGRLMRIAGICIDRGTGKTELNCWG